MKKMFTRLLTFLLVLSVLEALEPDVNSNNLYEVLGIPSSATSDEIKKAFRKLSISHHPDKNSNDQNAPQIYLKIQRAFETLIDVSKRITYDLYGEQGLEDLDKNPKRKGGDYRPMTYVPLELFYTGGDQVFNFRRGEICKHCKGTGDEAGAVKTCPVCGGTKILNREVKVFDVLKTIPMKCNKCKGLGLGSSHQCPVCKGQKIYLKNRDLNYVIEKGMTDGDKVVFKGESEQGFDFYPGDVILTLKQAPHKVFTRQGNNLRMEVKLSLKEAILGFERVIKHLDGHVVEIFGEENTQDEQLIVVPGEGMPIRGEFGHYGDLLVTVKVAFPASYT